ncbi:hypothetical protein K0M31_005384 [Melipona bicolor]|uniref:Uncharacterized protein n=1 Tax=Melipona bicolor TaxID=60889 RepID=A0AA40FUY9_9HYME|nr:hypothetical protein K0M31_005384 [Melipona bicolor]
MADEPEAAANEESAKRKGFPMAGSFVVDSTPFCRSVRFVHEEKSNSKERGIDEEGEGQSNTGKVEKLGIEGGGVEGTRRG